MNPVSKFRFLALLIVVVVGDVSITNLLAEFLRPPRAPLAGNAPIPDQLSSAELVSAIAPFRSDLRAERALMLAGQALKSQAPGESEREQAAQNAVRSALNIGPHDSRMWLVLALLEAKSRPVDPRLAGSFKMSYLTGPNRADLIPARLEAVTSGSALSDPDLNELARSDVRAILTHFPDQRQALVRDYAGASQIGKMFLDASVRTTDPNFVDTLQSAK